MTQKAYIAILGNASSFLNSVRESLAATKEMQVGLNELSVSTRGAAEAQVAATVKKTARMREEVATYQAIAAASTRGSAEQIAATNLANRSQLRLAGSLGVSAREHEHLSRSASGAERDLGRATRGALAGTGVFHTLGRSIAFASGGFLAFAGAGEFITKSISAARDAAVTQRQLGTQLRASGTSFDQWGGRIEQADLKLSHISGFTSDQLESSLTMLVRSTGNVNTALNLNALAADVARGRHIGLAQAAVALGKAYTGNASALKRLGIEVPKGLSGMDALNVVSQKFAGQARAGATASQRFGAELHNSQIIIGTALLPTLNQYLAKGSDWLSQMNRSGKLQRDVAGATRFLGQVIGGTRAVITPMITAFRLLGKAVGGTKHEVELLGTAFIILKTRAALVRWGLIGKEIAGLGTNATSARGKVNLLRGALLGLGDPAVLGVLGVAAADVAAILASKGDQGPGPPGDRRLGQYGPDQFPLTQALGHSDTEFKGAPGLLNAYRAYRKGTMSAPAFESYLRSHFQALQRVGVNVTQADLERSFTLSHTGTGTTRRFGTRHPGAIPANVSGTSLPPTLTRADELRIALATNPNDLNALRGQAALDTTQIAALKRKFAAHKLNEADFTSALTNLLGDRQQQESQITQILQDEARSAREAHDKRIRAAKAAERVAQKAREGEIRKLVLSRTFGFSGSAQLSPAERKRLGVDAFYANIRNQHFVTSMALQLAEAKAGATVSTTDDMAVARRIKAAALRALKSGHLAMQGQIDAWNAVAQANSTLGNQAKDAMTGYRRVGANAITAGLHLTVALRKELDQRISQSQAHFGHAPTGAGVLGQQVTHVHGPVYVNADNPHQLTESLRKAGRHTAHQRRGHNAGARAIR